MSSIKNTKGAIYMAELRYDDLTKCSCGYATHNLESCKQKECPRYKAIEIEKARVEMEISIKEAVKQATSNYLERVANCNEL